MILEEYVSFEIAKLLKEKGFDEYCPKSYFKMDKMLKESGFSEWEKVNEIKAPTQAMAMKWLRKVHGLFISIGNDDLDYNWQIFDIDNRTEDLDPTCLTDSYAGHEKYEQAVEADIKYCLEHLI